MHLRLYALEHLFQFLSFQRNDLVIVCDLLHALDHVSLGLRFGLCDLFFECLPLGVGLNHTRDDLVSLGCDPCSLKREGALPE